MANEERNTQEFDNTIEGAKRRAITYTNRESATINFLANKFGIDPQEAYNAVLQHKYELVLQYQQKQAKKTTVEDAQDVFAAVEEKLGVKVEDDSVEATNIFS